MHRTRVRRGEDEGAARQGRHVVGIGRPRALRQPRARAGPRLLSARADMRALPALQDTSWNETSFYAWRYERPTSVWTYLGSVMLPLVVILACLFPLAPWWLRMAFVYLLMALLAALLALLSVRYVLFGAVWMLTGSSLWLFPNLMSDEASGAAARKTCLHGHA